MTDVSERLSEIRERVEAATEGPWRAQDYPQRLKGQGMSALEVRGVSSRAGPDRDRVQDRHIAFSGWDGGTHRNQMEANAEFVARSRSDVPYLLSLVGYLREELCLRTCNCGPTDPNPEKHAGYCNYVEAFGEISAALRDAAQEGAE